MKIFTGIALFILLSACADVENEVKDLRETEPIVEQAPPTDVPAPNKTSPKPESNDSKVISKKSEWSYEVVLISENNWGYQLFQKGTMIINQTSIPSIQGIDGFDSKEKADRTAKYILTKLENGIFPPTVNKEELDSLNVLKD